MHCGKAVKFLLQNVDTLGVQEVASAFLQMGIPLHAARRMILRAINGRVEEVVVL